MHVPVVASAYSPIINRADDASSTLQWITLFLLNIAVRLDKTGTYLLKWNHVFTCNMKAQILSAVIENHLGDKWKPDSGSLTYSSIQVMNTLSSLNKENLKFAGMMTWQTKTSSLKSSAKLIFLCVPSITKEIEEQELDNYVWQCVISN